MTATARLMPEAVAVVEPLGYGPDGRQYRQLTFRELDEQSDRIAGGLARLGVVRGTRLALLVRPGIDFVTLTLALFKAGAVTILIDPGMGRRSLIGCLEEVEPQGFVAIPPVHAARILLRQRFSKAHLNVTVGRRWFWGGPTLDQLRRGPRAEPAAVTAGDPAAIIFTTGSTGPSKGVLYRHGNFASQIDQLRDFYGAKVGEIDLSGFPLFGLFNCALGITTVIPDMDPSRPAQVDPAKIVEAVEDWQVTQTFGSPAIWDRVGRYCEAKGVRLATVRRVLSAGAPVPAEVLARMKGCIHPEGDIHTPYGATEALPVASIAASEVLAETAARTRQGAGVCVGRRFPGVRWRVMRIVDGPISSMAEAEDLPAGQIGELVVTGPAVTREYVNRPEANRLGKIADGDVVWHRMGDAGYLDAQERFWFCGRLAHRVTTAAGPMYPVQCEAVFNQHPAVKRSALVGVGPAGAQRPVLIVEPHDKRAFTSSGQPCVAFRSAKGDKNCRAAAQLVAELRGLARANPLTATIDAFLIHGPFPVDIRHNVKISREKLAAWAKRQGIRG
jgi:olefin beta-lactone synthetase